MKDPIDGKVVVLTGASAGVGRSISRMLGRRGCKVVLIARGMDGLQATKREIETLGGEARIVCGDVADPDVSDRAAGEAEQAFGGLDVWINNAMVSMYAPFWEIAPKEFRHITEVTYLGQVYGTMAALRRMRPRDKGTIVQVGSALAHRSIPLQSAYCGAKHGVAGFTESLRSELMHERSSVRITLANLPAVNTPQFTWTKNRMPKKARPAGPIFQPEVAAEGIVFAAEHPWRKEVLIGGSTVEAVLGERVIPGLLDHYLSHAAWDGSMLDEAEPADKPDNFWNPLSGDYGAHGRFDALAKSSSLQLSFTKCRPAIIAATIGACVAGVTFAARRVSSSHRA